MNDDISYDSEPGNWNFRNGVAGVFDSHVRRSVPGYDLAHDVVIKMSDHFLREGDRCVDIGCSTGTLLNLLAKRHSKKNLELYGVDIESEMIKEALNNRNFSNINYEEVSLFEAVLTGSMVIAVFVIQFLHPRIRQNAIDKIYRELDWGGGFFMFEKVRGSDARFNDIMMSCHWEWKREQGFSDEEIIGKWRSLKGVMEPFSEAGNIDMMRRAGFEDVETIWKWGPFQGFLAIK